MAEYFENNTAPMQGYFEIVSEFISMMLKNASTDDVNDFLYETGKNLSERFPVRTRDSLSNLHLEVNSLLSYLGFGTADIEDISNGIRIVHRNIRLFLTRNLLMTG